tara:strand:- start:914 stop:1126 length:213 start_codon:yes stop_codon:yes gene_type:complete
VKVEFMRYRDGVGTHDLTDMTFAAGDPGVLIQAIFTPEDNHDVRMISEILGRDFKGTDWRQTWASHVVKL